MLLFEQSLRGNPVSHCLSLAASFRLADRCGVRECRDQRHGERSGYLPRAGHASFRIHQPKIFSHHAGDQWAVAVSVFDQMSLTLSR